MIGSRFSILTYASPGGLLNASSDVNGRPGSWQQVGIPEDVVIASIVTLPLAPTERERYPEGFRLLITYTVNEPPPAHLLRDLENERRGFLIRIMTAGPEDGDVSLLCEGCGGFVVIGEKPSFEEVEDAVNLHRSGVHGTE